MAGEPWPDGDGEVVPYPPPGGPYDVRTKTGQPTVVRWVAPPGFRIAPKTPVAAMSAAEAVASRGVPDWMDVDAKALKGTFKALPARTELSSTINESLIIELYSK